MDRTRLNPGRRAGTSNFMGMIALAAALVMPAGPAAAQGCDTRWPQLQFARDDMQRAGNEGDLASAQDYADRARRGSDHLAALATRCECAPAAAKFEETAAALRRAQDVDSRKDLRDVINGAKSLFQAAQAQLQECRKP